MTRTDYRDDAITGASAGAVVRFEQALAEFQCYAGDPVATVDAAIAESPGFTMAHCFRAWLYLTSSEAAALPEAEASWKAASRLAANARENGHLAAIRAMLDGEMRRSVAVLGDVLTDYPHDAVALQTAHLFDFYLGDARALRDRIARVLPAWSISLPGYHAVLGMRAFGLEESNMFGPAEEAGRCAVAMNAADAWAQHAVAHVMEMQGRTEEGVRWMASNQTGWEKGAMIAVHNWWHWALFHLDQGLYDKVLAFYDERVRGSRSKVVLDMIDASALLWRLAILGVDVGDRWQELADAWEPLATDAHYAFNDLHAMMAFVGDGRQEAAQALLQAQLARMRKPGDNATMTREVGRPLCRAILAFGQEDYDTCVDLIQPVRTFANRFGGSNAQRDVIDLTLIAAAERAGRRSLVQALANERLAGKPESPLNLRFRASASAPGRRAA